MRTNYIPRLIVRITSSSQSNNDTFVFYGHRIDLQSGTPDYVDITIYRTADRYSGEIANFSFDFWCKELYIEYAETKALSNAVKTASRNIYGHIKLTK